MLKILPTWQVLMLDPSSGTGPITDIGLIRSPSDPCKKPLQQPGFNRSFTNRVFFRGGKKVMILTIVSVFTFGHHERFPFNKKKSIDNAN